jgi:hypothetical protein
MTGDPLCEIDSLLRGCVIVQWSYQGVMRSQLCDANAGTLAISLADWIGVTVLAPDGEGGPSIVAQSPFLISVYPNPGGRRSTATITSAPQSLHNGLDPTFLVTSWANVERWRWWWSNDLAVAVGQALMIEALGLTAPIAQWYEVAAVVPPAGGATPLLAFDRWEAWPPGFISLALRPQVAAGMDYAQIRAYIKSEV